MGREAAGTVYVQIDGDNNPLIQKFAQTEALAKAAGQKIAGGLGSGLQSATGLVDQFGRSIASSITQPAAQAAPVVELTAKSVKMLGDSAEHAVPQIAAASGAIRVLEGNMPIRAVERFATSVLGLGPILQAAFPIVGLIATGEMIYHVAEGLGKASEAQKEAAKEAKQFTSEIDALDQKVSTLQVTFETLKHGAAAGLKAELEETAGLVDVAAEKLDTARQALHGGRDQVIGGKTYLMPSHGSSVQRSPEAAEVEKAALELKSAQLSVDVKMEELAHKRIEEQKKAAAEAKQIRTAAIAEVKSESELLKSAFDEELADAKSSHLVTTGEEKKFWENRLEIVDQWGGRYSELHRKISQVIGTLNQEDIKQQQEADKKKLTAQLKDLEMTGVMMDAQIRTNAESQRETESAAQRNINLTRRTNEFATKGQGSSIESDNTLARLRVQQKYELDIVHSKQQEFQYAQQMAGFDEKNLQIKHSIAQIQLIQAIQENALTPTLEGQLKISEDQLQVLQAQELIDKQRIEDETKLASIMQKHSLAGQIQGAVGKGPANFGDAKNLVIANATGSAVNGIANAFGRAVQGGEKFSKIMSQLGRQILGEVVSGIAKIGLQMAITALTGKALGSSIAVAEVTSAAAVGAANAAAATAAIPIVGPELAPGVAAATFAEIMAFAPLASYDKGGPIFDDQIAKIHKGEWILTADQMSGRAAMPSLPVRGSAGGGLATSSNLSNSHSVSVGAIHLHGVRDLRDVARRLPDVIKTLGPQFSPAAAGR